jgi:hypothetical protein
LGRTSSGLLVGFVFAKFFKMPNYKKQLVYDWENQVLIQKMIILRNTSTKNGNFNTKTRRGVTIILSKINNVFYLKYNCQKRK